jgi:hypothetical protein
VRNADQQCCLSAFSFYCTGGQSELRSRQLAKSVGIAASIIQTISCANNAQYAYTERDLKMAVACAATHYRTGPPSRLESE